jgi:two-component system, OmpR family, alkaline phosphatase synthesis response regulator PhoP
VVILDVMLPRLDGISLCRAVRAEGTNRSTAILMLTARDTESDKVVGLDSGADDYLTKPFVVRELLARVNAILRGTAVTADEVGVSMHRTITLRDVALDLNRRQVVVRGKAVELTKQEFDLLHVLVSRPGVVFNREALLARVGQGDTDVTERAVDTIVSRLRRKIEADPQDPRLIVTTWGIGYKFTHDD